MPAVVSYTCPSCGKTSYNPTDARFGYCAKCDAFTMPERSVIPCSNRDCGKRVQVVRHFGARFAQHDTMRGLTCPTSGELVPEVAVPANQ